MFFCFCDKVVSKILPFRKENKKFLDPIWNKHHIERVEIVLKETLDVKGDLKIASTLLTWDITCFL